MALLTKKESEVLLKLFKDFGNDYNANSLSKEIAISSRGALKILKKLEKENILFGKKLGKARFYKLNLEDLYVRKTMETLLIAESREKAQRWIEEFKEIFNSTNVVIIFGSIIKNPKHANDIDVIFIYKKQDYRKIANFIFEKNKVLFKKIHDIPQTMENFKDNLKNNKAIIDAIRTGYVLHGFDKVVEAIKDVTSF